jgi:hypothetical protein
MDTLKRGLSSLTSPVIIIDSDSEDVVLVQPHKKDILPVEF